jgi:hypothetical protein
LGIVPFTIFLVMLLMALSNMIYIVDKVDHNQDLQQADGMMPSIYKQPFDSDIWNAIVHTYLLSLGEFDFDDFG